MSGNSRADVLGAWSKTNAFTAPTNYLSAAEHPQLDGAATMNWKPRFTNYNDNAWFYIEPWCITNLATVVNGVTNYYIGGLNSMVDGISATNHYQVKNVSSPHILVPVTNYIEFTFATRSGYRVVVTQMVHRFQNDERSLVFDLRANSDGYTHRMFEKTGYPLVGGVIQVETNLHVTTNAFRTYTNVVSEDACNYGYDGEPLKLRLYGGAAQSQWVYGYWTNIGAHANSAYTNAMIVFEGYVLPLANVEPLSGPLAGGNLVLVTNAFDQATNTIGSGVDITNVTLGGKSCLPLLGQGTNWVSFNAPPGDSSGRADIVIYSTSKGISYLAKNYTYNPTGVIYSVSPTSGVGGTIVTILGENMGNGTDVTNVMLGSAAAAIESQSSTQVVVTVPSGSGTVDVRMWSTSHGYWMGENLFTYEDPLPDMRVLGINGAVIASGEAATTAKGTDFGSLAWGSALTNTFAITNSGNAVLTISGWTTNSAAPSAFIVSGLPATVDVGMASTFTITFAPPNAAAYTAAVAIANNSTNTPYIVYLSGMGEKHDQAALTFSPSTPQTYNTTNGLNASGGSGGGAFSYTVTDGPGQIVGSTNLHVTNGMGTVTIVATKAGDTNYNAASVTGTVDAIKGTAGVYLQNLAQIYDGSARNVTATSDPSGLTIEFTYDGNAWAPTNAGSYSVTGTVNDVNWSGVAAGILVVGKSQQSITFDPIMPQKATGLVGLAATGGGSGNPVTFSLAGGPGSLADTNLSFTGIGDVFVVASQAGNADFDPAPNVTNVVKVFSVTPDVGPFAGDNTILVTNGNFGVITNVLVGTTPAAIAAQGASWVRLVMPSIGAAGITNITIQTTAGNIVLADAYTYNPAGEIGGTVTQAYVIGTGSLTNAAGSSGYSPIVYYYYSSHYQFLYQSNDFMNAGLTGPARIMALGFDVVSSTDGKALKSFFVRMKHTDVPDMTIGMDGADLTVCYSNAGYIATAGGFDMLTFDTPFEWDGSSNVIVDTAFAPNATWCNCGQTTYDAIASRGSTYRTDAFDTRYDFGNGTTINVLPRIRILAASGSEAVVPSSGSCTGGYPVVINGENLGNGSDITNVMLCGASVTSIDSQSSTQIVVTAGIAVTAGVGDVRVFSTSFGETVKSNAFTYTGAGLVILGTNGATIASGESASVAKGTDFGPITWGSALTNTFAITNSGDEPLIISGVTTNGAGAEAFIVQCSAFSVDVGSVSNFTIQFAPPNAATYTAAVAIANNSQTTPYIVCLSGTGEKHDQAALTFSPSSPRTYNTTNALSASGGSGGGALSFAVTDGPGQIVGSTNLYITAGTGMIEIVATKAGDADYNAASITAQVACAKADQTITFPAIPDQDVAATVALSATASSGLPVTFAATAPGQITGGNQLSFTGTGLVTVTASQAGNTNWNPAPNVANTFNVTESAPGGGTLSIQVTPAAGSWSIVNPPAGYTGPRGGTGNLAPIAAPAGTYNMTWDELDGYVAPAPATGELVAGGTLAFTGIWLEVTDDLPPPDGVSATDGTYTNYIRVIWQGVPGATGYEIWRNTNNDQAGAVWLAHVPAGVGVRVLNPLEGERLVSRSDVRSSGVADTARVDARPPSEGMDGGAARVDARPPVESDSGTSAFSLQVSSLLHYDDYAIIQNASYYYWVRAKTAVQISRLSYVGAGYAGLNQDQTDGTADLAVSDLVFLPVNMHPDTFAGTVSLRLKNLGPDALKATGVEFDFYMGMAGGEMLWIGEDRQNFTLAAGAEELVIMTPQSKRGIATRGDQSGVLIARVRARHLTNLRDPDLANNITDAAGRVRVSAGIRESRRRGLTDYDGDGKTEPLVLSADNSQFVGLASGARCARQIFVETGVANPGYQPALGDYDGDGLLDLGLYEESTGIVYAQLSGTDELVTWAGLAGPGYTPVTGDYDGDGVSDPGLYQEATGLWIGRLSGVDYAVRYTYVGAPGYAPLHADYDGDGKTDPAVYSASDARLMACLSSLNHVPVAINIGGPGWVGVKGDFDGDGMSDPAVYNEATGTWWGILSRDGQYGAPLHGVFGGPGWMPVPADYDGDGKSDPAIQSLQWNPRQGWNEGFWYGLMSSRNYAPADGWFGGPGYEPVGE